MVHGGGYKVIFVYKQHIKDVCKYIGISKDGSRPRCNYSLCRSVFPEVNKQALLYFLKTRTKNAFITLLAVWHLGAVADAIFWVKRKLRRAKGV